MKNKIYILFIIIFVFNIVFSKEKHSLSVDQLIQMKRIGSLKYDKINSKLFFTITEYNYVSNKGKSRISFYDIIEKKVNDIISDEVSCYEPSPSPDGKYLAFISSKSGSSQIYLYNYLTKETKVITNLSTGVSGLLWSQDSKRIAFVSEVYPECDNDECNKKKIDSIEKTGIKARLLTHLPYRVWNYWKDNKRSHLFVLDIENEKLMDITSGDYDVPPIDLNGNFDYSFSPDGKEICYAKNIDKMIAISTNNDLFIFDINSLTTKKITNNLAADNQPVYSPNGRYIAFRSMKRPGFEADKYSLMIYDRESSKIVNLTENFDASINEFIWSPDSKSLFFTTQQHLYFNLCKVDLSGNYSLVIKDNYITNIVMDNTGENIYCLNQSLNSPSEIHVINLLSNKIIKLTDINQDIIKNIKMNDLEEFSFKGANNNIVYGFLIKPPDFNSMKKYPLVMLIHGGPQGAWTSSWSYRWNPQMFASEGYVVVCINPRGSTGYGQKFCDEISGDWGGKVYQDLMKGLNYILNNYKYIDKNKIAAAGASYGGYMVNWILGHNNKFKCLISHAGVYNLESMYGTTEELWFPEWEFKGTPWENPLMYSKFSPHKFAKNFKTPTLVIHGELDYRVPISEGMQLFTALQRKGIDSKFLYFPDEGHWVQKPKNLKLWFDTMFNWLRTYLQDK